VNKTKNVPYKRKNKKIIVRNIAVLALSIVMLIAGVGCITADQMLNNIQFVPQETTSKVETGPLFEPGAESGSTTSAKAGILGGLYHDDAVTNILLLGVDDYQKNDTGRSDSMMLVSVDTRHKKLKLTSFMRDMYVAIPGHSSNRINVAYSDAGGGAAGAKLLARTIEANFGTDIDRYVIISNSAFNKIIDKLGGVTITLTSGEAKLVNQYSGDSRRNLTAGTFLLSGAQAHYYSRIRAIGDDFERTERQRKVFSSIVDKFKTASIGTVYSALSETLQLVTTNMTKNEIISMAGNSLTYLNFPISQERIPADNEYQSETVNMGGVGADVLVPDLKKSGDRVSGFIYEGDLPTKTYQGD
jgi:polyisoprenyl-teichoic acid--peptidoglycan teichoic acid transferase